MKHKHYEMLMALVANPSARFEIKIDGDWYEMTSEPYFNPNPDYEYRVRATPHPHEAVIRALAEDSSTAIEVKYDGEWLSIPESALRLGSDAEYRVKLKYPPFRIGDFVETLDNTLKLVVTGKSSFDPVECFAGTTIWVDPRDGSYEVGHHCNQWARDEFQVSDSPFKEDV